MVLHGGFAASLRFCDIRHNWASDKWSPMLCTTATLYNLSTYSAMPVGYHPGRATLNISGPNGCAARLRWVRLLPRRPFCRIGRRLQIQWGKVLVFYSSGKLQTIISTRNHCVAGLSISLCSTDMFRTKKHPPTDPISVGNFICLANIWLN